MNKIFINSKVQAANLVSCLHFRALALTTKEKLFGENSVIVDETQEMVVSALREAAEENLSSMFGSSSINLLLKVPVNSFIEFVLGHKSIDQLLSEEHDKRTNS